MNQVYISGLLMVFLMFYALCFMTSYMLLDIIIGDDMKTSHIISLGCFLDLILVSYIAAIY